MKFFNSLFLALPVVLVACNSTPQPTVTSFEECAAAGYPIMESYPEQCRTPDGQTFVNKQVIEDQMIVVVNPQPGDTLTENVVVEGEARGTWFFEGSFPIELRDGDGNVLAQVPAQALGEWMTADFVPFKAEFTVDFNGATNGVLVLKKDNPSGLPEYEAQIEVPVLFQYAE